MNENENNVNNNELDTQSEENGVKAEKVFTQEEVNKIVSDRLERERAKAANNAKSTENEKEIELRTRENRLTCKEFLIDNGYSTELLDCVDTSDIEQFKMKVKKIQSIQDKSPVHTRRIFQANEVLKKDIAEEVFKRNIPHKPVKRY